FSRAVLLSNQVNELPTRLPKKYALRTQRLVTEDGKCKPGIVVVENAKIAAIGSDVALQAGVPTYDLGSAVLTPGLVAAHSSLGLASAIDEAAEADAGQIRAADAYDPQQRQAREPLEGGCTSVLFAPSSANVVAGACSGVRLGAAEPLLGDAGMKFVLTASSRG